MKKIIKPNYLFYILLLSCNTLFAQFNKWDNQKAAKHGRYIKQYEIANNANTKLPLTVWDATKKDFNLSDEIIDIQEYLINSDNEKTTF